MWGELYNFSAVWLQHSAVRNTDTSIRANTKPQQHKLSFAGLHCLIYLDPCVQELSAYLPSVRLTLPAL